METSTLRPQTPRDEVEPEDEDEASSPLTISELAYRLVEFENMVSAARNLNLSVALATLCSACCSTSSNYSGLLTNQ